MDWLSLILGGVGTLSGIGGVVIGWLGWQRSGQALIETQQTPIRAAQHALLPRLAEWSKELETLLEERVNYDVQQTADTSIITQDARELRSLIQQMTDPVIVDTQLDTDLQALRSIVIPRPIENGLADRLEQFSGVLEKVAAAKKSPASPIEAEQLLALGAQHQGMMESIRVTNSEALELAKSVRARVRVLEREGLGSLGSPRVLDSQPAVGD